MKTKLTLSIISCLLLASFAFAQTDLGVAPGLTPKSLLYFFDGVGEWFVLQLTFDKIKKAEKKLEYASERLAELKKIEEDGSVDKNDVEKIKDKYQKLSDDVSGDVDSLKNSGKDVAELVKKIESITMRHTIVLEGVLERAPEQAKESIEHALEVSRRGHERAIEAIEEEIEEGDIDVEDLEDELEDEIGERKEERERREEMKPGAKINELDIDDDESEVEDLTKEIGEDELKDLSGDIDTIEKSTR